MTQPPMIFAEAPPPADERRRRLRDRLSRGRDGGGRAHARRGGAAGRDALDRIAERARDLVHKVRQRGWAGRARRLPARVRALEPRGRRADVPRRGAAAHPRCRDRRSPDQGQARPRRLAPPSRRQRIALRQCLDLGADADRPGHPMEQQGEDLGRRAAPPGGAQRRAGDPPGGDPGHAHPRPPVRHGPDHRGGAGARAGPRRSGAIAIPTTCWARPRAPPRDAERYDRAYRAAIAAIGARRRRAAARSRGPASR